MLQNVTAAPLLVVHHVEEEQSWTEEVSACLSPDWDVGEDIGNVSRLGLEGTNIVELVDLTYSTIIHLRLLNNNKH